jgi:hypothetical protein
MFILRSEPESSAGFQPAVSQDFILQTEQTCQTVQVNSITMQVKNLRYSRTGVLRYAFGLSSTIETPKPPGDGLIRARAAGVSGMSFVIRISLPHLFRFDRPARVADEIGGHVREVGVADGQVLAAGRRQFLTGLPA